MVRTYYEISAIYLFISKRFPWKFDWQMEGCGGFDKQKTYCVEESHEIDKKM